MRKDVEQALHVLYGRCIAPTASRPGVSGKSMPTLPISTNLRTRSGRLAAMARASPPPKELPTRSTESSSKASRIPPGAQPTCRARSASRRVRL